MFPIRLDSALAYDIAKAMMDGFNRHYRLFREASARASARASSVLVPPRSPPRIMSDGHRG